MNKEIFCNSINLLMLLINPIVGLISNLLIFKIKRIKKLDIVILSFNISLIIIYLPMMADTKYNFLIKEFLKKNYIDNYSKIPIKFTYHKIIIYLEKVNFKYMDSFMLYVFFCCIFCFLTYIILSSKKIVKKNIYLYIYFFYLVILCNISGFNRFNLSILIINFAIFYRSRILRWILFLVAYLLHQGTIIILLIYIFSKFIKIKISPLKKIIIVGLLFLFTSLFYIEFITLISKLLKPFFNEYFVIQLNYFTAKSSILTFDFRIIIKKFFEVGIIYIAGSYYFIKLKTRGNDTQEEWLFFWILCIQVLTIKLNTFSERMSLFNYILLISLFYKNRDYINNNKIEKLILIFLIIRFITYNFFVYGYVFLSNGKDTINDNIIKNENIEILFTTNTFFLLENIRNMKGLEWGEQ